jgi:hypothetical protein
MADLRTALASEDVADIQAKSQSLMQASMKLGEAMYKASQDDAGDAGGGAAAGGSASAEDVVDADFEEIPEDRTQEIRLNILLQGRPVRAGRPSSHSNPHGQTRFLRSTRRRP